MLKKYCDLTNLNLMKILFLELPKISKSKKNTCLVFVSTYIICLWNLKDNRANSQSVIQHIKWKILQKSRILRYALSEKYVDMVTHQFSMLAWDNF